MKLATTCILKSFVAFTRNREDGIRLVFSKDKNSRFHIIWNFDSGKSVGRKVLFFSTPLAAPEFYDFLNFLFIFMLSFSKTF